MKAKKLIIHDLRMDELAKILNSLKGTATIEVTPGAVVDAGSEHLVPQVRHRCGPHATKHLCEMVGAQLTDKTAKILQFLIKHPGRSVTIQNVVEGTGLENKSVSNWLHTATYGKFKKYISNEGYGMYTFIG